MAKKNTQTRSIIIIEVKGISILFAPYAKLATNASRDKANTSINASKVSTPFNLILYHIHINY